MDPVHTIEHVLSAVRSLGAPPIGSADDMRAHADRLRTLVAALVPAETLLQAARDMPGAEGPAADAYRDQLAHEHRVLTERVERIRRLVAYLEREAMALDAQQGAWSRAWSLRTGAFPGGLVATAQGRLGWKLP